MAGESRLVLARRWAGIYTRMADNSSSAAEKRAFNSAGTAWYLVQKSIEAAKPPVEIDDAWGHATKAGRYAKTCRESMEAASSSKGNSGQVAGYYQMVERYSGMAMYELYQTAKALNDQNTGKYLAVARKHMKDRPDSGAPIPSDKLSNHDKDRMVENPGKMESGRLAKEFKSGDLRDFFPWEGEETGSNN